MDPTVTFDWLNYGVLGAWTVWLIFEKKVLFSKLQIAIESMQRSAERNNALIERFLQYLER